MNNEIPEKVRQDILSMLKEALDLLKTEQHHELTEISNHVIHNASIFQDEDSLGAAIAIYALAKTVQRCCEKEISHSSLRPILSSAYERLRKNDFAGYRAAIKNLMNEIRKLDSRLKLFVEEVITKSKIKKGSKLHEHGLSVAKISELTGVSQWELMQYLGKTITYVPEGRPVLERLKIARELFR